MREIKVVTLDYLDEYIELAYNTYPSFKNNSLEGKEEFKKVAIMKITDPQSHFMGMFEDDKLIAAMRLIDFKMNFFNQIIDASGLASVAVHPMYKKEKIAKMMVEYYENFYLDKNAPIVSLLPFRPDFYKKMGYGLGTKMNQYRLHAKDFPAYYEKMNLKFATSEKDKKAILDFYHQQIMSSKHGMIYKIIDEITDLYNDYNNKIVISYNQENEIDAYLIFEFENGKEHNYTINNMYIKEVQYTTADSLNKILGFIKKQDDQVNLVIYNTQDEYFAQKIDNPLNDSLNYVSFGNLETNTQLIGIMYKIIDIEQAFKLYDYRTYNNVSLNVCFNIIDENAIEKTYYINFKDGKASLVKGQEADVSVSLSIIDFSSLFMGCISVVGLYNLGLLEIDNLEHLNTLDLAFYTPTKPMNNTDF